MDHLTAQPKQIAEFSCTIKHIKKKIKAFSAYKTTLWLCKLGMLTNCAHCEASRTSST